MNSTVATEALGLGMPVAVLGKSTYAGSEVLLDCSDKPELLAGILDFQPEEYAILQYLAAVLRHQIPYRGTDIGEIVRTHPSIKVFIERMNVHPPKHKKKKKSNHMTVCIYCGCDVKEQCCGHNKCPNCGRSKF